MSNSDEDNLAPALNAASRAMTSTLRAKLAGCGFDDVTPAVATLLNYLDATGARPTTLAQRAGITKQAVSQLIRELEARGYVELVSDATDTRAKIVRLTKSGVALRAACARVKHELQTMAISKLGKSRVSELLRDLTDFTSALEETSTVSGGKRPGDANA